MNRKSRLAVVLYPIITLLGTIVVVAPWTLRNCIEFHAFIPVSANAGENLLLGNSENVHPLAGANTDISPYQREARGLDEVQRDRLFRERAKEWILENPRSAFTLYAGKVINYFNYRNKLVTKSEASRAKDFVLLVTYYPLLLISLLRLGAARRMGLTPAELLWYSLYFGNALLSAVFFTRIRFRIPYDFLLLGIAAVFLGFCAVDSPWLRRQVNASVGPSKERKCLP